MEPFKFAKNKHETIILIVTLLATVSILIIIGSINIWILISLLLIIFLIRLQQGQLLGTALQVNDKHFYRLKQIIENQSYLLDIKEPKLFIQFDPILNAGTIGYKAPYSICLNSSLVESLTEDELEAVIGHEMGHARFNHPRVLSIIITASQKLPFTDLLSGVIFGFYQRSTEVTADRIALLLTENPRALITALIKIYVGPKFLQQIDEETLLDQSKKIQKNFLNKIGELPLDHPYLLTRIKKILELAKEKDMPYYQGGIMYCRKCRKKISVAAKFCPFCGTSSRKAKK